MYETITCRESVSTAGFDKRLHYIHTMMCYTWGGGQRVCQQRCTARTQIYSEIRHILICMASKLAKNTQLQIPSHNYSLTSQCLEGSCDCHHHWVEQLPHKKSKYRCQSHQDYETGAYSHQQSYCLPVG